ncbi:DUF3054 domain-containing protein [Branchiibius cervicis]|uniref:DUF3054 domain-containing protein n=1 Tax=Branchiibius cervicis TaxID=908252 RepID=A0ABW2ARU2_9MICO
MAHPIRRAVGAFVLDVLLVVLFAAIGRRSHDESGAAAGVLSTAGPFLAGLVLGWVVSLAVRRSAPVSVNSAVSVWFATVFFGMVLRVLTGRGIAVSFVIVASVVLAVFLLGWRWAAGFIARRLTS